MAPSATPYSRHSGTASTIANDLSSQIAGKVILTTGVSPNGIGAKFVEEIAKHKPALLILAGRSASKLQATADTIASEPSSQGTPTRNLILDLSSQKQIREAANEVLAYDDVPAIDVLVLSAGVMAGPYDTTADELELHWGSNHIGHFLFTNLIMKKLLSSPSPRVVSVSSDGHALSPIRWDDPNWAKGKEYDQWKAYGQSKTANILFATYLAEKLGPKGLHAYSLHPGVSAGTSLAGGALTDQDFGELFKQWEEVGHADFAMMQKGEFDWKTLDECAATHVVAAFDPRLNQHNGAFLKDGDLAQDGDPREWARGVDKAERLWKLSETTIGEKFEF